jgi:hypothetical protein
MFKTGCAPAVIGDLLPKWLFTRDEGCSDLIDSGLSFGMPRIADDLARAVAFLYPTVEAAERNERIGGAGFLAGKPIEGENDSNGFPYYLIYAVSNFHVVWSARSPVIRLSRRDGQKLIVPLEKTDWVPHPDGDDLAVAFLSDHPAMDGAIQHLRFIETQKYLRPDQIDEYDVGLGDDVFMFGRFVNHQGDANSLVQAVRFGSVSAGPSPIWNPAINEAMPSFAVEMRSRTGFSGSPVAIYRTESNNPFSAVLPEPRFWRLIGVNWGYILEEDTRENTWLNGVVPAWRILELLEVPTLRDKHDAMSENFRRWKHQLKNDGATPAAVGPTKVEAAPPANGANPNAREDFTRLLGAAVRTPEPKDQT